MLLQEYCLIFEMMLGNYWCNVLRWMSIYDGSFPTCTSNNLMLHYLQHPHHNTHTNCFILHIHYYLRYIILLGYVNFLQRSLLPTVNIPINAYVCFGQYMLHLLTPACILIHIRRILYWISTSITRPFSP